MVMNYKIEINVMFIKYKSIYRQFKLYEGSKFRINTGFVIKNDTSGEIDIGMWE